MMATLEEFLLGRIAEDEAVIEATREGWHVKPRSTLSSNVAALTVGMHPSRARAECEAKRRIMREVEATRRSTDAAPSGTVRLTIGYGLDAILRALALPYADHPDYNEAWRA